MHEKDTSEEQAREELTNLIDAEPYVDQIFSQILVLIPRRPIVVL